MNHRKVCGINLRSAGENQVLYAVKIFVIILLFCLPSLPGRAYIHAQGANKSIPEQFDKGTIIAWVLFAVAAGVIGFFQARKVLKDDEKKDPE